MANDSFRKFLESEAEKNKAEVSRDAKDLAKRVSLDDYEGIRRLWQGKSYTSVAFMLRRYGLEFKGIGYMEILMNELINIMEQGQSANGEN